MIDELIGMHDIWYCLTCRRCSHICPNQVRPADIIEYARKEALKIGIVSHEQYLSFVELGSKFQRVRWYMAEACLNGSVDAIDDAKWLDWYETPVPGSTDIIDRRSILQSPPRDNQLKGSPCFTCGECSSACPISGSRNVFDPRFIFRMTKLGMIDELIRSPMLWLCLECGRCTDACSQRVDGRQIIQDLQAMAIQRGAVNPEILNRMMNANAYIYPRMLDEIDIILRLPLKKVA